MRLIIGEHVSNDQSEPKRLCQEQLHGAAIAEATPESDARKGHDSSPPKSAGAREFIETLAERKIKGFCGTIDDDGNYFDKVYAGSASLTESVTADYRGRFLIELVQNAYDVHPHDRVDGEIKVCLDLEEGAYGTLYVANRGAGFSKANVDALCDIGLSSKPPGESIGNKGLGFRSVLHITDAPLIFSQAPPVSKKARFDGFCFGFASDDELDRLISNPLHRSCAERDLPRFRVPWWHEEQSEAIRKFAAHGFGTVISLPLRDDAAQTSVIKEIEALGDQTVPLLLFLTRLRKLSVRVSAQGGDGSGKTFSLIREEIQVATRNGISIADLGDAGTFLIAKRSVPEHRMKEVIADGVARKQLHSHWLGWEGEGEVALAVRLNGDAVTPRLYTFLPMGEQASAPFRGYMHGSFFPTSNRKGLDAEIHLNALIVSEGASLAADAVVWLSRAVLRGEVSELTSSQIALAAVDLLTWRHVESLGAGPYLDLADVVATKVALASGVTSFNDAPVIPCLSNRPNLQPILWSTPAMARWWRFELPSFSAEVAAVHGPDAGFTPLWPGLEERLEALNEYLSQYASEYVEVPTATERADLVTHVAATLAAKKRTPNSQWTAFYRDLVDFFKKDATILEGREILLCSDGNLYPTMAQPAKVPRGEVGRRRRKGVKKTFIFSPPARMGGASGAERDLIPPADLKGEFAFLLEKLDWYGELASARSFLENAKLISPFDRETVLSQLSQLLRQDGRKGARAAGLLWAFQIWRRPRETGRPIKLQSQHRFFVPTETGDFIDANDAVFSEDWPAETLGGVLQRFLSSAPPDVADLQALKRRMLAPPSHYAFNRGRIPQWVEFLTELGVQRGLQPIAKKLTKQVRAFDLRTFAFCNDIGIGPEAATLWKDDIEAENPHAISLPSTTDYIVRGDLWWLPGQGDFERFNNECRELYGSLIVAWCGCPRNIQWRVEVHHLHFHNSDSRRWPTPFASFFRSAPWVPMDEPTSEGTRRAHVPPPEIWLSSEGSLERFPPFLPRPAPGVARALERATADDIGLLRERAGIQVLHDPDTLIEQSEFLAQQYENAGFDRYFERQFINLYNSTWHQLASQLSSDEADMSSIVPPDRLLVRRGDRITVIPMNENDAEASEPVYVRDCDDETAASLIEASENLFFDPRVANPARIGSTLRSFYGGAIRLLSETNYSASADGQEVGSGDVGLVLERCPSLKVLVAISMEALKGTEMQRLPADRSIVVARLERVALQRADSLVFRIDSTEIMRGIGSKRAFAFKYDDRPPLVVVRASDPLNWDGIDASLGALCEAIDVPALEPQLRVLVYALRGGSIAIDVALPADWDLERLCAALHLKESAAHAVRDTLGARIDRYLPWLRALVHMGGGIEAVDKFRSIETDAIKAPDQLRTALAPALGRIPLDADLVLDACRGSLTVAELRDELDLGFEILNTSLVSVGERPDTYPELHANLVSNYVHENEVNIIDALRGAYAPALSRGELAPEYKRLREEVRSLVPDRGWLFRYHQVPPEHIAEHVDTWLAACGATRAGTKSDLPALEVVRRTNAEAVRRFAKAAGSLIRAWCLKEGRSIPELWTDTECGGNALRTGLDDIGVYDYRELDEAALLKWCVVIDAWPKAMPVSLDRDALGLEEADLFAEKTRERVEAEARKREARSVPFNGRIVDPEVADWHALAAELASCLSKDLLSTTINSQPLLQPRKSAGGGDRKGKAHKKSPPAGRRASSEKTDMVGRLGELVVYNWLKNRLPKQNIDAAWKSGNAEPFTTRKGDDGAGYDFEVTFRNQIWQIEVKASLGDPCMFEMGESEVRAARDAARPRSGSRYAIAYVSNVGEPAQTRLEMLPNPMSEEGEGAIYLLGEGIRYGFRRN